MMVQNLHHLSSLSPQRTPYHTAESFETLQSKQCILVTGPTLMTSPFKGNHPEVPYLATLLGDIVEWCVSNEVLPQPALVKEWRTLVKEHELLRLIYHIEEYFPHKRDFQRCLSEVLQQFTPVAGFHQFLTTYTFRGYISTTYDTFLEHTYLIKWQNPLTKLYPITGGLCVGAQVDLERSWRVVMSRYNDQKHINIPFNCRQTVQH